MKALCDKSIDLSPDNELPHMALAFLAFIQNDSTLAQQQLDWATKHPNSPILLAAESELAIAEGRFRDAIALLTQSDLAFSHQGSGAAADSNKEIGGEFMLAGDLQDGLTFFKMEPLDSENGDDLVTLALSGDAAQSERLLKQAIAKKPKDTLLNDWAAPVVRAVNALAANRPQDAIAALTVPGVLDNVDGQIPRLRGTAYLALHQPKSAEAEFRKVIAHPEREYEYALDISWLGLARSLAAQGKRDSAIQSYEHFLTLWRNADDRAENLVAAKQELTQLGSAN